MFDQLIIGNTKSLDDFGASVAARVIKPPKKKSIKETVPFSNVTYDFSAINGEIYWEERELQYQLEMIAESSEELESMKTNLSAWLMNIQEESLIDPHDTAWHYLATFDSMEFEDDESLLKTTAVVNFFAYPYKIANVETSFIGNIPAAEKRDFIVINNSAHRITPTIKNDKAITVRLNNVSYAIPAGTSADEVLKLEPGTSTLNIQNNEQEICKIEISFFEEVF